jgi:hypothetical protein
VNRLYLSRVNALKWILEQSTDNNHLDKLKRIILIKIQKLKKEKKKAIYLIETIRIIEEIDNLEFCLNAIDSSRYNTKLTLRTNLFLFSELFVFGILLTP